MIFETPILGVTNITPQNSEVPMPFVVWKILVTVSDTGIEVPYIYYVNAEDGNIEAKNVNMLDEVDFHWIVGYNTWAGANLLYDSGPSPDYCQYCQSGMWPHPWLFMATFLTEEVLDYYDTEFFRHWWSQIENSYLMIKVIDTADGTTPTGIGAGWTIKGDDEWIQMTLAAGTCLDVIAHEIQHAILWGTGFTIDPAIEHKERWALGEAYGDVFGQIIEEQVTGNSDWIGPTCGVMGYHELFRNISDPEAGTPVCEPGWHCDDYYAAHFQNYDMRFELDEHNISTVFSYSGYMLARTIDAVDTFNGVDVKAIGHENTARLWYRTMENNKFGRVSHPIDVFSNFREAIIEEAWSEYDEGLIDETMAKNVKKSLDAVGIWSAFRSIDKQLDADTSFSYIEFEFRDNLVDNIFFKRGDNLCRISKYHDSADYINPICVNIPGLEGISVNVFGNKVYVFYTVATDQNNGSIYYYTIDETGHFEYNLHVFSLEDQKNANTIFPPSAAAHYSSFFGFELLYLFYTNLNGELAFRVRYSDFPPNWSAEYLVDGILSDSGPVVTGDLVLNGTANLILLYKEQGQNKLGTLRGSGTIGWSPLQDEIPDSLDYADSTSKVSAVIYKNRLHIAMKGSGDGDPIKYGSYCSFAAGCQYRLKNHPQAPHTPWTQTKRFYNNSRYVSLGVSEQDDKLYMFHQIYIPFSWVYKDVYREKSGE